MKVHGREDRDWPRARCRIAIIVRAIIDPGKGDMSSLVYLEHVDTGDNEDERVRKRAQAVIGG
jgi:hypothetical protein